MKLLNKILNIIFNIYRRHQGYGVGYKIDSSGELNVIKRIKEFYRLKKQDEITIYDIGANVGVWSEAVLTTFQESVSLHIFEPQPSCFEILRVKFESKAILNANGLGSENGELNLFYNRAGAEIASLYQQDIYNLSNKSMETCETIKILMLDDYIGEEKIEKIHFIKMDVEGHELEVLRGCNSILKSGIIDFIQFEFGVPNIYSRTYVKDFFDLLGGDFEFFLIGPNRLTKLMKYSPQLEVFATTNYLCVRRGIVTEFEDCL
jgi:FkbM family methyltransferase